VLRDPKNHTDDQIKAILRQWLDPNTGTGYSLFRICLGTSDFSDARAVATNYPQGWYSYQDNQSGPFSITNDVKLGIIRVIQLPSRFFRRVASRCKSSGRHGVRLAG